jgi:hypothetical protein
MVARYMEQYLFSTLELLKCDVKGAAAEGELLFAVRGAEGGAGHSPPGTGHRAGHLSPLC